MRTGPAGRNPSRLSTTSRTAWSNGPGRRRWSARRKLAQFEALHRPEPSAVEDVIEFRQVKVEEKQAVAEFVDGMGGPAMADPAGVEAALHQSPFPKCRHTARALLTPSSWKP